MKILFCGDFVPGGILHYQKSFCEKEVLEYMNSFDFRICTLECAIGTNIPNDKAKMQTTKSIIYSTNEDFHRVKTFNFNIVSLANNHITDLGKEGLINTIKILDNNGIKHFGAGLTIEEAKRPAIIEHNNLKIAFIGCLFNNYAPTIFHSASQNEFGTYQTDIESFIIDIKQNKSRYDKVIVMPHWGEEHNYMPPVYCYDYAKRMIDAGADAIIGSHPHIVNPHIKYKGKDIYFSLGNFLFPDICLEVPRPMFYPKECEVLSQLPRIWAYPSRIYQPSLAVWKKVNRVGMMVEMSINNSDFITKYQLISLSINNILRFYKGIPSLLIKSRLKVFAFFIKIPQYRFIRKIYTSRWNIIRRIKRKIQNKIQEKNLLR